MGFCSDDFDEISWASNSLAVESSMLPSFTVFCDFLNIQKLNSSTKWEGLLLHFLKDCRLSILTSKGKLLKTKFDINPTCVHPLS